MITIIFQLSILLAGFYRNQGVQETEPSDYIAGFDISSDDEYIVYSYLHEGKTSIRRYDFHKKEETVLISESNTHFYTRPSYSPSENEVIFIDRYNDSLTDTNLLIIGVDGTIRRIPQHVKGFITDAIFSRYSKEILYIMATEYTSYSPIGIKAFHKFDLYSTDRSGSNTRKITQLNAYTMNGICELDSTSVALFLINGKHNGIFYLSKNNGKIHRVSPANDPRIREIVSNNGRPSYSNPSLCLATNDLAFINIYELFVMSMENRQARSLHFSDRQIQDVKILNSGKKIIFTKNNLPVFHILNIEDKNVEVLDLEKVR